MIAGGLLRNRRNPALWLAAGLAWCLPVSAEAMRSPAPPLGAGFVGSAGCRECHEQFYELWAPSRHGLAMQSYAAKFAAANLESQSTTLAIGPYKYQADIQEGWVREEGPGGSRRYSIAHVLGGRNVYYFLTPMERGRLQTLPLAYDVHRKQWFDTAASGVRHFPGVQRDTPVRWTDPFYTFNTSCYSCHVSQLSRNYDLKTDTYRTEWAEPGINCETCHGPGQKHVEMYRQARETGIKPNELGLISTRTFSVEQTNSLCNSCHAKMNPITASFTPGQEYFDHFDLVTLENSDFYPDGRDLGENYTMTGWRMSACVKSGKLDCMDCHTSSGRYRFQGVQNPNAACLPCHRERVENASTHTRHQADSTGNQCVACHMPTTDFARMTRSDHSMRPPTPAATLQFKSPNACNLCHKDQEPAWADRQVRQWYAQDYQEARLTPARLLDAARRGRWDRLDSMLAYLGSAQRDEIFTASLIRSLRACESDRKWPAVIKALEEDSSPLVRAAAAQALDGYLTAESIQALVQSTGDEYRLVRVRAAAALAALPPERFSDESRVHVQRATTELMESLISLPDDYGCHYNLGNIHMQRRDYEKALGSYQTAIKLRPDFVPSYVNIAFVYNATGDNDKAEASFRKALSLEPNSPVIHLNLGMLLGELNRPREAQQSFRAALKADPNCAAAAYNLGVVLAEDRPQESLDWCQKAFRLQPNEGRYGYTYAFFLERRGDTNRAIAVLEGMVNRRVPYEDAYALLGTIYLRQGEPAKAAGVYRAAQANERLDARVRQSFELMSRRLE